MLAQLLQFLFSGVTVGATYALAALGFTLIYNASNVINFAQGEFIMLGGMLAGHDECGSDLVEVNGVKKMRFYGMSSREAMNKYAGGVAEYRASEGKEVLLDYRGPVDATLQDILGGVRSACTYVGARQLKELSKRTTFIRVSQQLNEVFGAVKP